MSIRVVWVARVRVKGDVAIDGFNLAEEERHIENESLENIVDSVAFLYARHMAAMQLQGQESLEFMTRFKLEMELYRTTSEEQRKELRNHEEG